MALHAEPNARPDLVWAILAIEPKGPPVPIAEGSSGEPSAVPEFSKWSLSALPSTLLRAGGSDAAKMP